MKRDDALQALADIAHDAIAYVGAANYRHRQQEAHEMVRAELARHLGRRVDLPPFVSDD